MNKLLVVESCRSAYMYLLDNAKHVMTGGGLGTKVLALVFPR